MIFKPSERDALDDDLSLDAFIRRYTQFVNCISLNEIEMLIVEIKKNGNTMVRNVSTKLIVLTVLYHF